MGGRLYRGKGGHQQACCLYTATDSLPTHTPVQTASGAWVAISSCLVHPSIQEERKAAISRSVDLEELEKGVKNSIIVVNVSLGVLKMAG